MAENAESSLIKYISLSPVSDLIEFIINYCSTQSILNSLFLTFCLGRKTEQNRRRGGEALPRGAFLGHMAAETQGLFLIEL